MTNEKEYFISTKDAKGGFLSYISPIYALTEIEYLTLIKILIVEARSKSIGKKLLEVYRDSNEQRKEESEQLLKKIGVTQNGERKPHNTSKAKFI